MLSLPRFLLQRPDPALSSGYNSIRAYVAGCWTSSCQCHYELAAPQGAWPTDLTTGCLANRLDHKSETAANVTGACARTDRLAAVPVSLACEPPGKRRLRVCVCVCCHNLATLVITSISRCPYLPTSAVKSVSQCPNLLTSAVKSVFHSPNLPTLAVKSVSLSPNLPTSAVTSVSHCPNLPTSAVTSVSLPLPQPTHFCRHTSLTVPQPIYSSRQISFILIQPTRSSCHVSPLVPQIYPYSCHVSLASDSTYPLQLSRQSPSAPNLSVQLSRQSASDSTYPLQLSRVTKWIVDIPVRHSEPWSRSSDRTSLGRLSGAGMSRLQAILSAASHWSFAEGVHGRLQTLGNLRRVSRPIGPGDLTTWRPVLACVIADPRVRTQSELS
ncbi:hypothetical protein PoB_007454700 [Plakobranchus ocellatus]|uniref:Uncharacterized protein n=1 Tax=Plakobranchus ocellatus TaxID=259542 RepID=A0AAV4DUP3_9GAST|nr:hypothetical protein PoB_007454700 [Plakobranchus ocellatus]